VFDDITYEVGYNGVLSLDLETTGLDVQKVDILLVAMSAGFGNRAKSAAVEPTKEALDFITDTLKDPKRRVIGHNILKYDLPVLHYKNVVRFQDVKAKIVDTLPLVWLLNENVSHRLKDSVKRIFKYEMVPYEDAYKSSPAIQRMKMLDLEIRSLQKKIEKAPVEAKKATLSCRKEWTANALQLLATGQIANETNRSILKLARDKYGEAYARELAAKETVVLSKAIEAHSVNRRNAMVQARLEQQAYARDDARQTMRLYLYCRRQLAAAGLVSWADLELKVMKISTEMELNGVYVDPEKLKELGGTIDPLLDEFEGSVFDLAKREFNIKSWEDVQEVLYKDLAIPPVGEKRIDKTGKEVDETYSTKEQVLSRLNHPIAQQILNHRMLSKLRGTFITKLLKMIEASPDGRIHPHYSTLKVTGRWSCKKPNVQQIPSKKKPQEYDKRIQALGKHIRGAFRAPPGMKYIVGDLSQIELRLIAHVTEDTNLLTVYNEYTDYEGLRFYTGDIHAKTSAAVGVPRSLAKNLNFGVCYGISAGGFARNARLYKAGTRDFDFDSARTFRNQFMSLYCGLQATLDHLKWARNQSFPQERFQLLSGRYRHFPKEENAAPGKILNSIIQGSAADILKVVVWALDTFVVKVPEFAGAELIMQVHDEVAMYAPEPIAEQVGVLMKYIMEIPWFRVLVPVLASVKVCDDWAQKDDDNTPEIGVLPPKETGIKPCVAMLSARQTEWAAKYVKTEDFTFQRAEEME